MGLMRVACRELLTHRGRSLLTLIGIILGVALVVAVSLVNRSMTHAFGEMVSSLGGDAVLEVSGGAAGFAEDVLEIVRAVPVVDHAAPRVLGNLFLTDTSANRCPSSASTCLRNGACGPTAELPPKTTR